MSINSRELLEALLVSSAPMAIDLAFTREHNLLYQLYAEIEPIVLAADTSVVNVREETVEVLEVAFERKLLDRASEAVMDAIDADWRSALSSVPIQYVWKGEELLRQLRLNPPTSEGGELQVIEQVEPPAGVAQWHGAFLVLTMMRRLALNDQVNQRQLLVELLGQLIQLVGAQFNVQLQREARR